MAIECLVLGAGQEVGKSCVVVSAGGKQIMFDCGMHMGHLDARRYPDFARIAPPNGDFTSAIACIIITHFHLDHVGALPYFTEVCGYNGPIFMTYPTKALAPLMLEDYRKVMVERRGEEEQFTYDHIVECMKKVTALDLKQTVQVDKDLQIRAYYAGHVLGAAMIYAKIGESTMVYTGDYNMTPDRHLGAAQIDHLQLDLLITDRGLQLYTKLYLLLLEIGSIINVVVYKAACLPLGSAMVAIKLIDLELSKASLDDVRREAKAMALLSHPNVLHVHCSFTVDRHLWVVMPFVSVGSLQSIIFSSFLDGLLEPSIAVIRHNYYRSQ